MFNGIIAVRVACTLLSICVLLALLWKKCNTREHAALQLILVVLCMYDFAMIQELFCETMEATLLMEQYKEVSIYCVILGMVYFVCCYTQIRVHPVGIGVLVVLNLLLFFRLVDKDAILLLYLLMLLRRLVAYCRRRSKDFVEKWRKRLLLIAVLIPGNVYVAYLLGIHQRYGLIMISFTISATIMMVVVYRFRLFDVLTTTKDIVMERLDTGVLIYDADKKILYQNHMGKRLRKQVETIWRQQENEEESLVEANFYRGNREYEIRGNTVVHEDKIRGYSYTISDITELHKQIRELERARMEAEDAIREKNDFFASASHELRTPLNGIIGMSELALRSEYISEESRFQLKSVLHSAKNLLVYVNNILDFSKIEAGELELQEEEYSIERQIYEAMHTVTMSLGDKNICIEANIAEDVPERMCGDAMRVQHIMLNLLGNAAKYTSEGYIRLSIYGKINKADKVSDVDEYELHIDVEDTGQGIPTDHLDTIFSRYKQSGWRKKREVTGTGLGLSIAKDFANCMGGDITVTSKVGLGSTFYVTIHQKIASEGTVKRLYLTSDMIRQGEGAEFLEKKCQYAYPGASILVVDDINTNLVVCQGLLEPYRVNVVCADSADAAIDIVKKREQPFDLIFMDYRMPIKDGVEAVAEIRKYEIEKDRWTPIVAMTADTSGGLKEFFGENGFSGYLTKPLEASRLEQCLREHLKEFETLNNLPKEEKRKLDFSILQENGIETSVGMQSNGNNEKYYLRVLQAYKNEVAILIPRLNEMLEQDVKQLCIKVHGIKSGSNAVGALEVAKLAAKIEENLKFILEKKDGIPKKMPKYVKSHVEQLKQELELILKALIVFLKSTERKEKADKNEVAGKNAPKKNSHMAETVWWKTLKEALNDYDAIRVENLLQQAIEDSTDEEFEFIDKMQEAILALEYVECKALVADYLRKNGIQTEE